MRLTSMILALLLIAGSISSRDLTLEQALDLARQHSHQLDQAEANRQAATSRLGAARAERLPTLSATAYGRYSDFVPRLNLTLPGLGSINRDIGTHETYLGELKLTLPIYTGGRLGSAIELARSQQSYQEAAEEQSLNQLLLATRVDFLSLYRAERQIEAAIASRDRIALLAQDVRNSYEAGAADSVDLLEVRLAITQVNFEVARAESAVQTARIGLRTRLGLAATEQIDLKVAPIELPERFIYPEYEIDRPELRAAAAAVGLSTARVKGEQAGYLPSLNASAGYSYGKPNGDMFNDDWNDNFTAGAQLNWNFNLGRATRSRTQAARFEAGVARSQELQMRETIDEQVRLALAQLDLAHQQYGSARSEQKISQANYYMARERFNNGILSSNRLLEIETDLARAEAYVALSWVGYYIAQSQYYYATGDSRLAEGIQ